MLRRTFSSLPQAAALPRLSATELQKPKRTLFELIKSLPQPNGFDPKNPFVDTLANHFSDDSSSATWLNKNGYGLKAYQTSWVNRESLELMAYYTIIRFVPATDSKPDRVWGIHVFKGLTDNQLKEITTANERCWRFVTEEGTVLDSTVEVQPKPAESNTASN